MTTMEIDTPTADSADVKAGGRGEELSVHVHPLALVHMSDQYTRIRYGGSPLDASAPVVGLLFGKQQQQSVEHKHNNNKKNSDGVTTTSTTTTTTTTCYVEDAGDIPLEDAQKQIDLHQAVFPKHQVIGWYKVVLADNGDGGGGDDQTEPTIEDLQQTQQIQSLYQLGVQQKKDDPNAMDDSTATSSFSPTNTFFGLLHVPSMKKTSNDNNKKEAMETEGGEGKSEDVGVGEEDDEDDEDELPLTLYRLDQEQGGAAAVSLVALHTWSLHTSESERIAVQRVMREKAVTTTTTTETTTTTTPPTAAAAIMASQKPSVQQQQGGGGEEATATTSSSAPQLAALSLGAVEPQVIRPYADELQESCVAIAARLSLVLQYLETVQEQQEQQQSSLVSLPRTATVRQQQQQSLLLRQVQGLLLQLGILSGTVPHPDNYGNRSHAQQLQQVAALAKAVDAVTLFTEKFRFLTEHGGRGGGSSGRGLSSREVRRF